jgi:hypothetical protein
LNSSRAAAAKSASRRFTLFSALLFSLEEARSAMHTTRLLGLMTGLGLAGCTAAASGPAYEVKGDTTATADVSATQRATAQVAAPSPSSVTVSGQVVDATGAGIAGMPVLELPDDVYLNSILRTEADENGVFTLDGIAGDGREWFYFEQTGYAALFEALDTTSDLRQATPPLTLLSNADAAALAQSFGVTLDPDKGVVRVPVTVGARGQGRPALASEFQVTFEPPLDVPVHYVDGEALAFNVVIYDSYQVMITRNGHVCAPASHPSLVATDGSVEVRPMTGTWTVGPTIACE